MQLTHDRPCDSLLEHSLIQEGSRNADYARIIRDGSHVTKRPRVGPPRIETNAECSMSSL